MIDGRRFEQYFKEQKLKQGLKLFEKGHVELLRHPTEFSYHFLTRDFEVSLKLKNEEVQSFNCSCSQAGLCEHLAAALFYIYKESIQLSKKKTENTHLKKNTPQVLEVVNRKNALLQQERAGIQKLLNLYSEKHLLTDYLLDNIIAKLKVLQVRSDINLFFFNLAFCLEYYTFYKFRFTGDENKLKGFFLKCQKYLAEEYLKDFSDGRILIWQEACLASLKSNAMVNSRFCFFLIPRFLMLTQNRDLLYFVRGKIMSRKLKLHHSETIDPLKMALLQIDLQIASMQNSKLAFKIDEHGAECSIAKAELQFCIKKTKKAFDILETEHTRIKNNFKLQYLPFLEYVISKAQEHKQKHIEAKYLKEKLVYGLFISELDLSHLLKLVPIADRKTAIDELLERIGKSKEHYAFEKLSFLLLREERYKELITLIKKYKNKFQLLHLIALKIMPHVNPEFMQLYIQHLAEALQEVKYYQLQQNLIETASEVILKLSSESSALSLNNLLDKIGHQAQISKYILKRME